MKKDYALGICQVILKHSPNHLTFPGSSGSLKDSMKRGPIRENRNVACFSETKVSCTATRSRGKSCGSGEGQSMFCSPATYSCDCSWTDGTMCAMRRQTYSKTMPRRYVVPTHRGGKAQPVSKRHFQDVGLNRISLFTKYGSKWFQRDASPCSTCPQVHRNDAKCEG